MAVILPAEGHDDHKKSLQKRFIKRVSYDWQIFKAYVHCKRDNLMLCSFYYCYYC